MGDRFLQEAIDDPKHDDQSAQPDVDRSQLGWLLGLLELAMVHEAQHELTQEEYEDEDTDDLMGGVEAFGLLSHCQQLTSQAEGTTLPGGNLPCCIGYWS